MGRVLPLCTADIQDGGWRSFWPPARCLVRFTDWDRTRSGGKSRQRSKEKVPFCTSAGAGRLQCGELKNGSRSTFYPGFAESYRTTLCPEKIRQNVAGWQWIYWLYQTLIVARGKNRLGHCVNLVTASVNGVHSANFSRFHQECSFQLFCSELGQKCIGLDSINDDYIGPHAKMSHKRAFKYRYFPDYHLLFECLVFPQENLQRIVNWQRNMNQALMCASVLFHLVSDQAYPRRPCGFCLLHNRAGRWARQHEGISWELLWDWEQEEWIVGIFRRLL